ncbi:transcriptional repressor [Magnetovibrio blakemorei]|uniref:Fur family transcriptional regulator n=1 Tax=Magnetovibrio blakemorei TaxID=28181 RepID=A0A1E5QAM9_9PROT|nr:transcriptional repressor [Magnetovibrio blakemorei]OEJ69030.1 Fur family transcriptional regulator [Magnetovibrio blakemorei]
MASIAAPLKLGSFPDDHHDHKKCVTQALRQADGICTTRGVRLTDMRRQVFALVWQSHNPVGAYEVLEGLRAGAKKVQPPTVYRALEFLLAQGLIHRIESLNAYIGCTVPGDAHAGQFLICRDCGQAAELIDQRIDAAIDQGAKSAGFYVEHPTVELEGLCAHCRSTSEANSHYE